MATLDELKEAANPYARLSEKLDEVIAQNEIKIKLLDRLCELKETQQANDKKFRDSWRAAKVKDTRITMVLLTIASIALYLDYFRGWPVFTWLKNLVS